jgi:hypothetical protein
MRSIYQSYDSIRYTHEVRPKVSTQAKLHEASTLTIDAQTLDAQTLDANNSSTLGERNHRDTWRLGRAEFRPI